MEQTVGWKVFAVIGPYAHLLSQKMTCTVAKQSPLYVTKARCQPVCAYKSICTAGHRGVVTHNRRYLSNYIDDT